MAVKNRPNPRKLMELAIKMMRKSVAEPRADGKPSPRVGAVLWKPNGSIDLASRGELRYGDHAEYTLLERKNRDARLDGSLLFTTLEPCAPGARHPPKLSCAERIVLARVQEVWVGLEDPDPTVDRKGIKYLQDAGVKVHLFDRDLQQTILEENRSFIEGAQERAEAARNNKNPEPVVLSGLERGIATAHLEDLSNEALETFRRGLGAEEPISSDAFLRRLRLHGVLQEHREAHVPTGFGLLLFGKEPRAWLRQAGLLGTFHRADEKEETKDFDGPAIFAPEQALNWIKDKLPNPIDRSSAQRKEHNEALFELVREGVANALVHRDYSIEGAKCQLIVSDEKIVVMSPGRPVEPITMKQLEAFEAPMLSRNPVLHYAFAKLKLAEERGLGLKTMRTRAEKAGLPRPAYSYSDPYVVLTVYPKATGAGPVDIRVFRLSTPERAGLAWLVTRQTATAAEYANAMSVASRTAKNHLKHLTDLGLIKRVGAGRATRYVVATK